MKSLEAPFLELEYYVGRDRAHAEALRASEVLLRNGAYLEGHLEIVGKAESRHEISNLDEVNFVLQGKEWNKIRIFVRDATRTTRKTEVLECSRGIVLLRTEGGIFSGPPRCTSRRQREVGQLAVEAFLLLARNLDAAYGAICVEYSLEEFEELREDPRSLAFRNFFISRSRFGDDVIERILGLVESYAHVDSWNDGLYVSMTDPFSPDGTFLSEIQAQELSVEIGRVIASASLV